MNVAEILLSKRWIVKVKDRDLYYKVKDQLPLCKNFFTEKLGYQIIVNPYVIKLEKLPGEAQPWMGILEFQDKIQYVFLCLILMFLEEKEVEEQFVLSSLTEFIQMKYERERIDWTLYQYRRHLIKVIKVCVDYGMLVINDGVEEEFMSDYEGEVLYENTGVSRYFMRNFTQNISNFTRAQDFENSEWIGVNEDRGIIRRQRVYRKLLMSLGTYKVSEEDEDFSYIKNYRNLIAGDMEKILDCELQVHKTSAFLILGDEERMGKTFPGENTLSDIILLCNSVINEKINRGEIKIGTDEKGVISMVSFRSIVDECRQRYGAGLIKSYRDKTSQEFFEVVKEFMELYCFIKIEDKEHVILNQVIGKIQGQYPKDY